MFEHRSSPVLSRSDFLKRQFRFILVALTFVVVSLAVGIWGYMTLADLSLVDAFLNAAMILGGMGPVDVLTDPEAKIFAACYAIYSGFALLSSVAVILTPLMHRMMHILHLEL